MGYLAIKSKKHDDDDYKAIDSFWKRLCFAPKKSARLRNIATDNKDC